MTRSLDLNADVGEDSGYDEQLLDVVTSANIACGFHAGDPATMRRLCVRCAERGVAVGAQVSYRDREGFGRRDMEVGYDDLLADVLDQLELLAAAAESQSMQVAYLKPHGALYHRVARDRDQARAVVDAAATMQLPVLGLPGAVLLELATERGLRVALEFFADRAYAADGTLVPRSDPQALVRDPDVVATRVRRLVDTGTVVAADGAVVPVHADSICVHSDTPDAPAVAHAVAAALRERSFSVRHPW